MSKIGYIRISTEHQEKARQQEIMGDYQARRIFSEKQSVSTQNASQFATDRPQLRAMLDYVREGDTLYIERMGLLANTFYRRVREYEATHGIVEPISA